MRQWTIRITATLYLTGCHVVDAFLLLDSHDTNKGRKWGGVSRIRATVNKYIGQQIDNDESITYFSPNVPFPYQQQQDVDDRGGENTTTEESNDTDRIQNSLNEYSFFDEAIIYVRAGSGGQGASTYKKLPSSGQNGPPDGGNGGKGGHVVLQIDPSLNTLAGLTHAWRPNSFGGSGAAAAGQNRPKSFRAENGADGDRQFKNGRSGKNVVIRVPPGTIVQEIIENNENNNNSNNISKTVPPPVMVQLLDLGRITADRQPTMIVAKGGNGGEGSGVQRSSGRGVKRLRAAPTGGERKMLKLTLQLVADVALVGVPNAGKSTFLASVTRAKPKISNYPFTTVIPNLGVWTPPPSTTEKYGPYNDDYDDGDAVSGSQGLILCDVPGLVAGAAQGVGLGHAFLRHVERCHVILHLVDATSIDPIADYQMLNREIVKYGTGQLAQMPQVVVVNKIDAFDNDDVSSSSSSAGGGGGAREDWERGLRVRWTRDELEAKLKEFMPHSRLMWMSAKKREGVDELMTRLASFVQKVKETLPAASSTSS